MLHNLKKASNKLTLAIHSTDDSYGFACRENDNQDSDNFFINEFKNDLCNNLVYDFNKFFPKNNICNLQKISVSIGPANFNASRLIVVLARTISQQINCPIDSFSCFELMAKRIALNNNIFENSQTFWIYKKLKKKGYIAGQYEILHSKQKNGTTSIKEKVVPKIVQELRNIEPNFQANYDDKKDLRELLNLSNKNIDKLNLKSWDKVLPLYPISPTN